MDENDDLGEEEFVAIKERSFLGIARIPLDALDFNHELQKVHRVLSDRAVARLENIFEKEGCLRLQDENHISAVVDEDELVWALAVTGLERGNLPRHPSGGDIPELGLMHVRCLHGLHRVNAAKRVLDGVDRWWTVRLYSSRGRLMPAYCSRSWTNDQQASLNRLPEKSWRNTPTVFLFPMEKSFGKCELTIGMATHRRSDGGGRDCRRRSRKM